MLNQFSYNNTLSSSILTSFCISLFLQVWRGALARMRCRKIRAIYTMMAYYKCYKVKAHFWEVERRFANVRNMADYGKSVDWPAPPAALMQFHRITQHLYRRYVIMPSTFRYFIDLSTHSSSLVQMVGTTAH